MNPFCYPPPPQVERMLPFWSDNIAPCVRDPVSGEHDPRKKVTNVTI